MKSPLIIYTDGACTGNPGPGGWGAFVTDSEKKEFEFFGSEQFTTNNRMEMMGAIKALEQLTDRCEIEIHTDSAYLKNGITVWIHGWLKNNWKTASKAPVKNQDLWEQLHALMQKHTVKWHWVKGHSGVFGNERADALARNGVVRLKL